jgi:hypothetical protein
MRVFIEAIALLVIGAIVFSIAFIVVDRKPLGLEHGELRCEGSGAVVINVGGKDYAVNGMATPRFPPIQGIWNEATYPEIDIGRLVVRGLTLCKW